MKPLRSLPLCLALLLTLSIGLQRPTWSLEIEWALFDATCDDSASTLTLACGTYGTFHFVSVDAPPGCNAVVNGIEEPPTYTRLDAPISFMNSTGTAGSPLGNMGVGGAGGTTGNRAADRNPVSSIPPTSTGPSGGGSGSAGGSTTSGTVAEAQHTIQATAPARIRVIDFEGAHGQTVTQLIRMVTGFDERVDLALLDDPALDELGPVGDFHVLAKLCEVAEDVDRSSNPGPKIINMSFGRALESNDDCAPEADSQASATCQIQRVMEHLKRSGVQLVAAAGNHREPLFPGISPVVAAAGMLDLNRFFNLREAAPAWETPTSADAWLPGNTICMSGTALPAGSSYSAAILTGWALQPLLEEQGVDTVGQGAWYPEFADDLGCYVLRQGTRRFARCNPRVDTLFASLAAPSSPCWNPDEPRIEQAPPVGIPQAQPTLPSLEIWSATTHPTPESDPCVPCSGWDFQGSRAATQAPSMDFNINLSQSGSMPEGVILDSVWLRVDDDFYPIDLDDQQLGSLQRGQLASLSITDGLTVTTPQSSLSLWYHLKDSPEVPCVFDGGTGGDFDECFWTSTPIRLFLVNGSGAGVNEDGTQTVRDPDDTGERDWQDVGRVRGKQQREAKLRP